MSVEWISREQKFVKEGDVILLPKMENYGEIKFTIRHKPPVRYIVTVRENGNYIVEEYEKY